MRRGFSLVEVIVVMGIMAIAVGVLLPAVHRARSRSQEIFCQANLRTLSTAIRQYNMDYAERYPFGMTWNRTNPSNGRPTDGAASGLLTWYSLLDTYLSPGANPAYILDANTGLFDGATTRNFHAALRCPSVPSNFQQKIHYYNHPVVMPHVSLEYAPAFRPPNMPVVQPAKTTQLYPNTALLWDTPLWSLAQPVTPALFWVSTDTAAGFAPPVSKIDGAQLSRPMMPELRFRGPGADRFAQSNNVLLNPAGPIMFASDAALQNSTIAPTWNTDFGGTMFTLTMGGPRFRHTGNGCNVLFADGSVQTLYLRPSRKVAWGAPGTGSADYVDSDFRRHMLMIKWPPGFFDTGSSPAK